MTITKGSTPSPSPSPSATAGGLSAGEQQALQGIIGSLGTSSASSSGPVWMPGPLAGLTTSRNPNFMPEGAQSRQRPQGQRGGWFSSDDATNAYFNWTQKQRDDFRAKGLLSGLLTQGAGDLEAFNLWQNLVKQSSLYGAQGQEVGPMDILAGYVKGNSSGGWIKDSSGQFETNPVTGERRYIGPQFKTTTQVAANLIDPATARAIATQVFQQLLGRDPNPGEISAYAQALSDSEAQNPSTTTTTTQYDTTTGEAIGSSSVNTGGMTDQGRALLASDAIKKGKEYGATQAATTYMNALESAVGGRG